MTSRDFCYWLQGYFELTKERKNTGIELNSEQVATIQRHLALVFKHEIDPSMGNQEKQQVLQKIHALDKQQAWQNDQSQGLGLGPQARC